jgi:hypothetical protein
MTEVAATPNAGAQRRVQVLRDARRRDSETKRGHVRKTVESMLLAEDTITFASVARHAHVSTWLVYADGVREHIQAAIRQQADQPNQPENHDRVSTASLRTDLVLARAEIKRLRTDNEKLRHNAQRLLGQQLDQVNLADLVARVDALAHENRQLASERQQARSESAALRSRVTELEEDVAAARTALRRMIREHSTDIGDPNR